jgi:flavodoxin
MKKKLLILVCLLLAFVLSGCSGTEKDSSSGDLSGATRAKPESQAVPSDNMGEDTEDTEGGNTAETIASKTLVVYFSATGNTKKAAELIASLTGGDLFELTPVELYSDDDLNWNDENSRVSYEHNNPDARDIQLQTDTVENFHEYDTVFIGYPIWWGEAAWPVNGFIQANDFTGKTVIPFCTSGSSGLGESGAQLAQAAGTGDWLEGRRFPSGVSESEISQWLDEIGY